MIELSNNENVEKPQTRGVSTTAVAVKEANLETALAAFPGMSPELAEMIAHDAFALVNINGAADQLGTSMPFRKIEYCNSEEAQTAGLVKGQFTDTLTGTQKPTMTVLLLAQKFSRVMQSKYDPLKDEQDLPLCLSHDGRARAAGDEGGTSKIIHPLQECATCPHSKWSTSQEGKQVPPVCSDVYTLLMFDVEDCMPFVFQIRRTGIAPWRKALQALKVAAIRYRVGPLATAPANLAVQFLMSTKAEKIFFRPQFSHFDASDADQVVQQILPGLASFMNAFQTVNVAAVVDEEAIVEQSTQEVSAEDAGRFPGEPAGFNPGQFGRPGAGSRG